MSAVIAKKLQYTILIRDVFPGTEAENILIN